MQRVERTRQVVRMQRVERTRQAERMRQAELMATRIRRLELTMSA
jgi:hypothetical protein